MKLSMHIIGLEEVGDHVVVQAQGCAARDADWQPYRTLTLKAPVHVGRKYRIGQTLRVTVEPGK